MLLQETAHWAQGAGDARPLHPPRLSIPAERGCSCPSHQGLRVQPLSVWLPQPLRGRGIPPPHPPVLPRERNPCPGQGLAAGARVPRHQFWLRGSVGFWTRVINLSLAQGGKPKQLQGCAPSCQSIPSRRTGELARSGASQTPQTGRTSQRCWISSLAFCQVSKICSPSPEVEGGDGSHRPS